MLSVAGLSKGFGGRTLFRDVTFRLTNGRRIALVGGNGVGKTTLLEIIVGTQEADAGDVSRQKDLRIGYLPQELLDVWESSVLDEVLKGAKHVLDLETELRSLEAQMAATTGDEHDQVMEACRDIVCQGRATSACVWQAVHRGHGFRQSQQRSGPGLPERWPE